MIEVGFDCNQQITKVQGNLDDPFKISINKFLQKSLLEPDNVFFIVNGKPINFEEKIEKQISKMNKDNKKCKVLVQLLESTPIIPKYEKSKDIICPKCYEPCELKFKTFIYLYLDVLIIIQIALFAVMKNMKSIINYLLMK